MNHVDLFELYRAIITTSLGLPVFFLLASGVMYLITPKPNMIPSMMILFAGFVGGLGIAVLFAHTLPLIVIQ